MRRIGRRELLKEGCRKNGGRDNRWRRKRIGRKGGRHGVEQRGGDGHDKRGWRVGGRRKQKGHTP